MSMSKPTHIVYICIIIILLLVIIYQIHKSIFSISDNDISTLTDNWCNEVTLTHNPETIASLFCSDGNLVGTVSQVKRKGLDIKRYFNYFAKLPNIKIVKKEYNISKVTNNVFINTAFITWIWDGLENPIVARMTFVFRDNCIFQLHSSALPVLNEKLLEVSKLE